MGWLACHAVPCRESSPRTILQENDAEKKSRFHRLNILEEGTGKGDTLTEEQEAGGGQAGGRARARAGGARGGTPRGKRTSGAIPRQKKNPTPVERNRLHIYVRMANRLLNWERGGGIVSGSQIALDME